MFLFEDYQEEWRYIVPKTRGFKFHNPLIVPDLSLQVKVSICTHPGEECGAGAVFSHYRTSCQQQFSAHLILNTKDFSMPSACFVNIVITLYCKYINIAHCRLSTNGGFCSSIRKWTRCVLQKMIRCCCYLI